MINPYENEPYENDPYKILGIPKDSDIYTIVDAYYKLAFGSPSLFTEKDIAYRKAMAYNAFKMLTDPNYSDYLNVSNKEEHYGHRR